MLQRLAQAPSQQTPSTQKFVRHSSLRAHLLPIGNFPQLPERQLFGAVHCMLSVQRRRHAPASQVHGAQSIEIPLAQVPEPSQTLGAARLRALEQLAALQMVPAANF